MEDVIAEFEDRRNEMNHNLEEEIEAADDNVPHDPDHGPYLGAGDQDDEV